MHCENDIPCEVQSFTIAVSFTAWVISTWVMMAVVVAISVAVVVVVVVISALVAVMLVI